MAQYFQYAADLAGLAMGLFGSSSSAKAAQTQYKNNLKLQQQAQAWNEFMYKNRYQMQVEDLEKAGINRLYGLGTAPAVTSGLNSVGLPDTVGEQNNKANQLLNGIALTQNLSAKRAEIKNTEQKTRTEQFNTQLRQMEVLDKRIDNFEKQKRLTTLDERMMNEMKQQRLDLIKTMAETNDLRARAGNAQAQTRMIEAQKKGVDRINDFHENNEAISRLITGSSELGELSKIIIPLTTGIGTGIIGSLLPKAVKTARRIRK